MAEQELNKIISLKDDDFEIEYDILAPYSNDMRRAEIHEQINSIDNQLAGIQRRVDELNVDIDRLTNHADGLDYTIAVISGVITGIVDSVFVGEWNFEKAKAAANQEVNSRVANFVKKDPRYIPWCENTAHGRKKRDPDRLESAIEFLEEHYHLPGDNAYQTGNYGIMGNNHRLDDFCHHPTLIGMICSVIVQFTESTIYSHSSGEITRIPIEVNHYGNFVGNNSFTKVMAGIINWFISCAKAISNQKGHLMSDIATSAGIPGSFLSTLKELSVLPCFKDTMFSENLRKAYENGIGTGKGQVDLGVFNQLFDGASSKFDKRTEMAIAHELKRQSIPVLINEALVRGGYFIRRFIEQMKTKKSMSELDWHVVLPFKNRTIVRMMTIASGAFMAVDMADAAIRSALKSKENAASFAKEFILRINFVGIGRFAIAVVTDVGMGIKKSSLTNERSKLYSEMIHLTNAKVFYKQANMWISAEEAGEAIQKTHDMIEDNINTFIEGYHDIYENVEEICEAIPEIEEKNPGLSQEIMDILNWG